MEIPEIHLINRPEEVSDFFPVNHEVRNSKRIADSTQADSEAFQFLGTSCERLSAVMFDSVAERTDNFIFRHCMEMRMQAFFSGTSIVWFVLVRVVSARTYPFPQMVERKDNIQDSVF
ncbi:hypothetical protein MC64_020945 [Aeromonas caviae]|nr:hypothetical protein MC64_020945 [Aeromonas caviae]